MKIYPPESPFWKILPDSTSFSQRILSHFLNPCCSHISSSREPFNDLVSYIFPSFLSFFHFHLLIFQLFTLTILPFNFHLTCKSQLSIAGDIDNLKRPLNRVLSTLAPQFSSNLANLSIFQFSNPLRSSF